MPFISRKRRTGSIAQQIEEINTELPLAPSREAHRLIDEKDRLMRLRRKQENAAMRKADGRPITAPQCPSCGTSVSYRGAVCDECAMKPRYTAPVPLFQPPKPAPKAVAVHDDDDAA
jgi:hypothetical protein